jgi:hypothetical protein
MIKIKTILGLIATISLMLTVVTPAADAKVFKASGTILRLDDTMLLLRAPTQDIELTRDAKTKVNGQLAKGAAATVIYDKVAGQAHATEITITPKKS